MDKLHYVLTLFPARPPAGGLHFEHPKIGLPLVEPERWIVIRTEEGKEEENRKVKKKGKALYLSF